MNRVTGKILLHETGVGIPNLLVTIYDVDFDTLPKDALQSQPPKIVSSWEKLQGDRLGSVLTDTAGAFVLEYEEKDSNEHRADLLLFVTAPEGPSLNGCSPMLHVSCGIRQNAGRLESYLISLTSEELKKAGVVIPTVQTEESKQSKPVRVPEGIFGSTHRRYAHKEKLRELAHRLAADRSGKQREIDAKVAHAFKRVDKLLSSIPESIRESHHYVPIDADIQQASLASLTRQIEMLHQDEAPVKMSGVAAAAEDVIAGLKQPDGSFKPSYKADEFNSVRFGATLEPSQGWSNVLVRRENPFDYCERTNMSAPQCPGDDSSEDHSDTRDDELVGNPAAGERHNLDIPREIAAFLETAVQNGSLGSRPDQAKVQKQVNDLVLRGGPADAPAYYDFHNLQIAFDHVWTEAFDQEVVEQLKEVYQEILDLGIASEEAAIDFVLDSGLDPIGNSSGALQSHLRRAYGFTIFAAKPGQRSVNFGLLVTYRQKWEPLNYQAGELVATIPLAPKEVRKFTKRQIVKKSRAEKEIQNNLKSRREDTTETSRAEAEIINKANSKTAFQLGTQTGANVGFNASVVNGSFNGSINASFSKESGSISEEVKREFREAVFKAAQEYKEERTVEIRSEVAEESEVTESGEISNPNDELTVTYLFYELQRRYRVTEQIHRVTPVIFIAQEVPFPNEIDEDEWIIKHDWILQRVLLDDSFRPALTYLASRVTGDEYAVEELRKNVEIQRGLVDDLKRELVAIRDKIQDRYAALEGAFEKRAKEIEEESQEEFNITKEILDLHNPFGWGEDDKPSPEAARVREDAARDAYERAAHEERDLRSRLDREVTALQTITEQYTKQLSEHLNRQAQIGRLRTHIKQNILYYMQSIWSYEPPDQRFFRLHRTPVPKLEGELEFNIVSPPQTTAPLEFEARCNLAPSPEFVSLVEVADLDQLLGYKGNYMIFPLKQSNCLTDFMMVPYVDSELGLRDPDELGNWTLESFAKYVCCLKKRLRSEAFDDPELQERLRRQYLRLLQSPRRDHEEIIVPTGELFIEALPGAHPLLEDFKLKHRAMDVEKVRAEVQRQQLENLRLAARLMGGELDDPDIDKKIVIEGSSQTVVLPEGELN